VRGLERRRAAVEHVLEEMRDAVVLGRLVTRTDPKEHRHHGAVRRRPRNDDHAQPVRENFVLVSHRKAVLGRSGGAYRDAHSSSPSLCFSRSEAL
jgi:hypothetical protein